MKKTLLIVLTLIALPFSTSYCEWDKDDRNLLIGTIVVIGGGYLTYRWYNQDKTTTSTNNNLSQQIVPFLDSPQFTECVDKMKEEYDTFSEKIKLSENSAKNNSDYQLLRDNLREILKHNLNAFQNIN